MSKRHKFQTVRLTQHVSVGRALLRANMLVALYADMAARVIQSGRGESSDALPTHRIESGEVIEMTPAEAAELMGQPAPAHVETSEASGGPAPENRAIDSAPETRDPAAQAKGGKKAAKAPPAETDSLLPPETPDSEGEGDGDAPAA